MVKLIKSGIATINNIVGPISQSWIVVNTAVHRTHMLFTKRKGVTPSIVVWLISSSKCHQLGIDFLGKLMVHESTNHEADISEGLGLGLELYYFLNARCYLVDTCNFLWHSVLSWLHLIHTVTPWDVPNTALMPWLKMISYWLPLWFISERTEKLAIEAFSNWSSMSFNLLTAYHTSQAGLVRLI